MSAFSPLYKWYQKNKRSLPWRDTQNPYLIWLSEVILQQTRVEQGLPYYERFTENFKTVKQLATANETEILKLWQGLGYYSRAVNMHHTAKLVTKGFGGKFPTDYENLILLKGIGSYTAAAVSSFAANAPHAVLDGNVFRVLSRLFNISEPINTTNGKKIFTEVANEILDKKQPALHNQAIMELGALVCKPAKPDCETCPLRLQCSAYEKGNQTSLPVKLKKNAPRNRYLNFIIVQASDFTLIKQRTEKGIWHKLYEPPCIETEKPINEKELTALIEKNTALKNLSKSKPKKVFSAKHQLTHQTLYADFWLINTALKNIQHNKTYLVINHADLETYPVHRLFDKFLQTQ